jgi:protein-S-isoprenylcysteine O-methyltransferase Ste14
VRGATALPHRHTGGVPPRVLTFVIIVVTVVWAVNFSVGVFITGWEGATGVNAVMMAAIGLLGAARYKQNKLEPPPDDPPPPREVRRSDE